MSKKVYIRTFGCQMNELDSQKIRLLMEEGGCSSVSDERDADIIIINTCAIREKATHKALSEIGRVVQLKNRSPNLIIGVCGCVAQQCADVLLKKFSALDFICGPDQLHDIPDLVKRAQGGVRSAQTDLIDRRDDYRFLDQVDERCKDGPSRYVTVIKGCNYNCAYCIVPSVRGREVSREPESVISEVERLVETGVREVTLLGQNVTAYVLGTRKRALADLISMVSTRTSIERIRFMAAHPADMTDDLIDEFAKNEKLCPHIHLPIQSGSDRVLRAMKRGYTRERYLEIINDLREAKKNISVTTDIIVGFPGERDEDFNDTFLLLKEIEFDSIFAFKYSPREGTRSFDLNDDVAKEIKEGRLEKILTLQREITWKKNKSFEGKVLPVLVTGLDRMSSGLLMGRALDNRLVNFAGDTGLIGSIVDVEITEGLYNSLRGSLER